MCGIASKGAEGEKNISHNSAKYKKRPEGEGVTIRTAIAVMSH